MNILVTGGAGFIGSNFIYHMLDKYPDYKIICVDCLTYAGNLSTLEKALKNPNFVFYKTNICDRKEIYKMFELNPSKKVILFFGGGEFGLGKDRTVQVLEAFIKKVTDFQIVAVAGKNEKMKEAFEELVKNNQAEDRVRVLGFTDKVPELMNISCLVVSKPGGLTTTESLASILPMIIINPIPGQEEENAEFLEQKGVAVWLKKHDKIEEELYKILNDPEKLQKMKINARLLAKKNSTRDICETLLEK